MHVTYALIKAYDGTLTFQRCLSNLQQIHFNVSMHRDFVVAARNIWPSCTFENQIVSIDRILLAICRNNKGEGERGWEWFNNIVQWTWIFLLWSQVCGCSITPIPCTCSNSLTPSPHTYIRTTCNFGWDCLLSDVCKSFILCINGKQTDCRFY